MPRAIYPWKKWLSQTRLELVRGVDYECQPHSMAQQVRNVAHSRGVKVQHITISDDTVTVELEKK